MLPQKLKRPNGYYLFMLAKARSPRLSIFNGHQNLIQVTANIMPLNSASNSFMHWLQNLVLGGMKSSVGRHEEHLNFSISTGKDILTGQSRSIVENKNCAYLVRRNLQHFLINAHSWHKMIRKPIRKNCVVEPSFLGVIVNDRQITLNV